MSPTNSYAADPNPRTAPTISPMIPVNPMISPAPQARTPERRRPSVP